MSPKGGSGKTVLASNIAMLAQQLGDGRVALVDADLQFGDDSLVLQLEPRLTVVNIVHDIDRLDQPLVDSVLARHPSGLRVLPAPLELVERRRDQRVGDGRNRRCHEIDVRGSGSGHLLLV